MHQKIPTAFADETGSRTTDRRKMEDICRSFYEGLFSSTVPLTAPDLSSASHVPRVTPSEVEKALSAMKRNRAAGTDQIRVEELRAGGDILLKALSTRFTWYLEKGEIPVAWKRSRTVLIPKKGNLEDIRNYRPICLLSHMYKVFMRVIFNRIESVLEENTRREQAGFRKRYSTSDHIFALSQLIERCREYRVPLCLLFVDFRKAFDSVEHNAVLQALSDQGVDPVYVRIIKDTFTNSYTDITLFDRPIGIKVERGVKQGDICSPKAFAATLEGVLRKIENTDGFDVDGEKLQMLLFCGRCGTHC